MSERVGVYVVDGERYDAPRYFSNLYPELAEDWSDAEVTIAWWTAGLDGGDGGE